MKNIDRPIQFKVQAQKTQYQKLQHNLKLKTKVISYKIIIKLNYNHCLINKLYTVYIL